LTTERPEKNWLLGWGCLLLSHQHGISQLLIFS